MAIFLSHNFLLTGFNLNELFFLDVFRKLKLEREFNFCNQLFRIIEQITVYFKVMLTLITLILLSNWLSGQQIGCDDL